MTMTIEAQDLADRYIAVWTEVDATERRKSIAPLWMPGGRHYVGTREVQGYDALESRIIESHEKWVRDKGNRLRATEAKILHDSITFYWKMLPPAGDTKLAVGLEFVILNEQGRIVTDYQYIIIPPAG
jgi:hypothetical protein